MNNIQGDIWETLLRHLQNAASDTPRSITRLQNTAHIIGGSLQDIYALPRSLRNENLIIDAISQAIYPSDAPSDLFPIHVFGDGNCSFRTFSLLLFGTQKHHLELRVRTIIELLQYTDWYLDEQNIFGVTDNSIIPFIAVTSCSISPEFDNVDFNIRDNCRKALIHCICQSLSLNSWVGIWQICALASVTKCKVRSLYPDSKVGIPTNSFLRYVFNRTLFPRINILPNHEINIMWTNCSAIHQLSMWQPNHFVPCISSLESFNTVFEVASQSHLVYIDETSVQCNDTVINLSAMTNKSTDKQQILDLNTSRQSKLRKRKREYYKKRQTKKLKLEMKTSFNNDCALNSLQNDLSTKHITCNNKKSTGTKLTNKASFTIQKKTSKYLKGRDDFKTALNQFLKAINVTQLDFCNVCDQLLFDKKAKIIELSQSSNVHRLICKRINSQVANVCTKCFHQLLKHLIPPGCFLNSTEVGSVPNCLKILNFMEKRFISQIHAFMTIVSLPAGSQYAQDGMVINFPVDICELNKTLPTNSDLNIIAIENTKSNSSSSNENNQEHKICLEKIVSRKRIQNSLVWLTKNNKLYHDVSISNVEESQHMYESSSPTSNVSIFESAFHNSISFTPNSYVTPEVPLNRYVSGNDTSIPVINLPKVKSQPINLFNHQKAEEMCFPWLFPNGENGLKQEREVKLSVLSYFQNRIMSVDSRWRKDISYLFWAVNVFEQHKLQEQISIAVRMRLPNSNINSTSSLTLDDLKTMSNNPVINENSYSFLKVIRGTAPYWKNILFDLLAKFRTLGPPTWFLTLSADDHHWEGLINFLKLDYLNEDISHMSNIDLVRSNPVLVAQYFVHRWKAFFKFVLKSKLNPLGEILDHFVRVEFQVRGSPHLHIFFWIKGAPDLKTAKGQKQLPEFLDRYVSTCIPPENENELKDLVTQLQIHKHTNTCQKKSRVCRFKFPRKPCNATTLKPYVNPQTTANFYETKRESSDIWVNAYNPAVLKFWQANMDIQFVGCSYGIASYVCSYVCKAEPMRLRQSIQDILCQIKQGNFTFRQQLSKIGSKFLSQRELSAQEAAFRITGLPLVYSSRTTITLNCRPPDKRFKVLKSKKELSELPPDTPDIFVNNIVDYYSKRPKDPLFQTMCLARFATCYNAVQSNKVSKKSFHFQAGNKIFKERTKPVCLKVQYMTPESDGDNYYYKLLFLYLPWYDENCLLKPYKSAAEAFINKQKCFDPEYKEYGDFTDDIAKVVQQLRIVLSENTDTLIDTILSNTTHLNESNKSESTYDKEDWQTIISKNNIDSETIIPSEIVEQQSQPNCDNHLWKVLSMYTMTDSEFGSALEQLSKDQRKIFDIISNYTKQQLFCPNKGEAKSAPYHIFITGGAGTGKSRLISVIYEYLLRSTNSELPTVIKTAPTGVAAYNIHGMTLHKAFRLPVDHKYQQEYIPLSGESLQELRTLFRHVNTIIIDEISMVSYRVFKQIHLRLSEIKLSSGEVPFAGMNIIAVGDFFQLKPVCAPFIFYPTPNDLIHLWNDNFTTMILHSNQRQSNDNAYAKLLNNVRLGNPSSDNIQKLLGRVNVHLLDNSFDTALRLFPTNKQCDDYNNDMTIKLQTETGYTAHQIRASNTLLNKQALQDNDHIHDIYSLIDPDDTKSSGLSDILTLAVGSRVMLIRNINVLQGLTNGALGTITQFHWEKEKHCDGELPLSITVKFDHTSCTNQTFDIFPISVKFFGKYNTIWERTQLPLRPSWATTIHKSQGLTLQRCVIDLSNKIFQPGMAYVALSRVTSLSGISLTKLEPNKIFASKSVIDYYETIQNSSEDT